LTRQQRRTGEQSDHERLRHKQLEVEVLAVTLRAASPATRRRETLLHVGSDFKLQQV
jgi:hypothetical protein